MPRALHKALSAAPSKLLGAAGLVITGWSAGDPTAFKSWWGWAMTPVHIRLAGLIGLGVGLLYWALLYFLKSADKETFEKGPAISGQTTFGSSSPAIGSIAGMLIFTANPLRLLKPT